MILACGFINQLIFKSLVFVFMLVPFFGLGAEMEPSTLYGPIQNGVAE